MKIKELIIEFEKYLIESNNDVEIAFEIFIKKYKNTDVDTMYKICDHDNLNIDEDQRDYLQQAIEHHFI